MVSMITCCQGFSSGLYEVVSMITCQGFSSGLYGYMFSQGFSSGLYDSGFHVVRVSQVVSMITCCQGFSSGLYGYMLSGFIKWCL